MFEIYEVMGSMVVNTDKSIIDLKRDWVKSLHEGFEIGKPLNEEQQFQMMIVFGEFLAEEIYELGENSLINKKLKGEYFKVSNSFGHYIDRFMFYAIQCYENGEKVEVPKNAISLIGDACLRAMDFVPDPDKVIDKFCKMHGIKLI